MENTELVEQINETYSIVRSHENERVSIVIGNKLIKNCDNELEAISDIAMLGITEFQATSIAAISKIVFEIEMEKIVTTK